jgi:hypothetical protein
MPTVSRRAFFGMSAAGAMLASGAKVSAMQSQAQGLSPLTGGARPITAAEHGTRVAKVQSLMQQRKIAALLVEAGSRDRASSISPASAGDDPSEPPRR